MQKAALHFDKFPHVRRDFRRRKRSKARFQRIDLFFVNFFHIDSVRKKANNYLSFPKFRRPIEKDGIFKRKFVRQKFPPLSAAKLGALYFALKSDKRQTNLIAYSTNDGRQANLTADSKNDTTNFQIQKEQFSAAAMRGKANGLRKK